MFKKIKELMQFLKNVSTDPRIPDRDRIVLVALIGLIISPFDIIPDWIPIIGWMDDAVIFAVVLDYFFNHLDQTILLSHYPWGMKSYVRLRKTAQFVAQVTPSAIKGKIWAYKPSVYER